MGLMNWDSKTYVLWRPIQNTTAPKPEDFISDGPERWLYAVEAFNDIYTALERGRGADEAPWLMTDEGVMYAPTDITALQALWNAHVEKHGRFGPEGSHSRE